jgi:phosphoribosylanthranilate isomerase
MNSVKVKICGIMRHSDVRVAVQAGADALGFVFAPESKRVLDPLRANELVTRVPAFVARVGLFMDQGFEEVVAILDQVPLNFLQFHGAENAAFCRRFGLPYIKAVSMVPGSGGEKGVQRAAEAFGDAAALLLDSHVMGGAGGTGRVFDWSQVPKCPLPLVLAGGLSPGNVRQAVEQVKPWAVDVSSGVEIAPGIKSEDLMRKFIQEAKREY